MMTPLLRRKLQKDWSVGEPRVSHLIFAPNTAVNNVKILEKNKRTVECLLSTAKNICSYEIGNEKIEDTTINESTYDNDEVSDSVWAFLDLVQVPTSLEPGQYVLSFRWDCQQSSQVWSSCANIEIV